MQFILHFAYLFVSLPPETRKEKIMETTGTIQRKRTREEILSWLDRARQRKIAWENEMQKKFEEEAMLRKQAEESHYYDIAF